MDEGRKGGMKWNGSIWKEGEWNVVFVEEEGWEVEGGLN
jgi:hypothetical protein